MRDFERIPRAYFRLLFVFTTIACLLLTRPHLAAAQETSITYQNPLAYVDQNVHLYVTSLDDDRSTLIAASSSVDSFSAPHWSPAGSQLAFIEIVDRTEDHTLADKLYVIPSGKSPVEMALSNDSEELGYRALAWSPDGKQIAYIKGGPSFGGSLHLITPNNSGEHTIAGLEGGCIGEGPGSEDAGAILTGEQDDQALTGIFYVNWIKPGILTNNSCTGPTTLFSPDGSVIWQRYPGIGHMLTSPDTTHAIFGTAIYHENDQSYTSQLVMMDLATGQELPLLNFDGISPLAWTNDGKSIIYSTQTVIYTIRDPQTYTHGQFMLTLWRRGLDETQGIKLFEHPGYAFGTVVVSPDDSTVVFSLVVNPYFDKSTPPVQLVAVPLKGGKPTWIANGGKPAFGRGSFTAIPDKEYYIPEPQQCPKSLITRIQAGQRAKVTAGVANHLRAQPIDGAILTDIPAASVVLVLDGPACGSDGVAWWQVNYQGTVGWTAESDSKSYWLEP